MTRYLMVFSLITIIALLGFVYWRYIWFFRNPPRTIPNGKSIISPADGTVVYVKTVEPHEKVIVIKEGSSASINDIARKDLQSRKALIGIFMSPFDVHYNRAPISGDVKSIVHYPAQKENINMGSMHLRAVLNLIPHYKNSLHILQNERTVTTIEGNYKGRGFPCYVIQIAGGSVNGIDSYVKEGEYIKRGDIFGMIRIGSQVDIVVPYFKDMQIKVKPGNKVKSGETILIE
jgi:phosphatidylserine decarboxylase